MKVIIGPYKNWIGPYQIADFLFGRPERYVDDSERTWRHRWSERLGDWLAETPLKSLCEWIDSHRSRQVYVRIDKYDTWSMDHTLAHIVLPMLKQLLLTKHGAPCVDDEDVPLALRSTAPGARDGCDEWDVDHNHFVRWDWVLVEMIWAFEQQLQEDAESQFFDHSDVPKGTAIQDAIGKIKVDSEGHLAWQKRKSNGYRLFGKYYEALWD